MFNSAFSYVAQYIRLRFYLFFSNKLLSFTLLLDASVALVREYLKLSKAYFS